MKLVSVDPGRHCGFAFMEDNDKVITSGMIMDDYKNIEGFQEMIANFNPDYLIIEDFRLAPTKAMQQAWNPMNTPRLIGILQFWAWQHSIPVVLQQPSTKQAFPDARLQKIGLYDTNRHTRDALRHGLYFLHFGLKKLKEKELAK